MPTEMTDREILSSLTGTVCANCRSKKKSRMSHCGNCYYALPREMRRALYRRFGAGYEEAFRESLVYLKENNVSTTSI
jgi:predicted amidophosphoribosyltransferase